MKLMEFRMAHKISLMMIIPALFLIVLGWTGYTAISDISGKMDSMYKHRVLPMDILDRCRVLTKAIEVDAEKIFNPVMTEAERAANDDSIRRKFGELDDELLYFRRTYPDDLEQAWVDEVIANSQAYRHNQEQVRQLAAGGNLEEAYQYHEQHVRVYAVSMDKLLWHMMDRSQYLADKENVEVGGLVRHFSQMAALLSVVFAFTALVLGFRLNRMITRPVNRIVQQVEKAAAGHIAGLGEYVPTVSPDELGRLSQGFYKMAQRLVSHVAALEKKNVEIYRLANEDALTGLPNRRYFMDVLKDMSWQQPDRQAALLFIDLDRFKDINDTVGHSVGDTILSMAANRIQQLLPEESVAARLGGDEFVVLLYDLVSAERAGHTAQQIIDCFTQAFTVAQQTFRLSCSIGIAFCSSAGQSAEVLLREADTAMYEAKRCGKNNYQYYTETMHQKLVRRLEIEEVLHQALQNDGFELYYQPRVAAATSEIVGMEALLRLKGQYALYPSEFIPVAEETGLIIPLGIWVLETACRQNKAWQQAGFAPKRVSVNMSPQQLSQPDIVEQIRQALAGSGLEPRWLELEITEGALMEQSDALRATVAAIKALGISLSIDDFGTGYSSLAYLKRFSIDCLKIDKTFIDEITSISSPAYIADAVISLGKSLAMTIVAEGVEDTVQLEFLQQRGCDEIQGYLFSRPLSVTDFTVFLAAGPLKS